jgi:putative transcriptional regulator
LNININIGSLITKYGFYYHNIDNSENTQYIAFQLYSGAMAKKEKINLNRLRILLAERNKTNRWLADQLGVTEGTVSKWATNNHQPPLERLYEISQIFKIDIHDLIESTLPKK